MNAFFEFLILSIGSFFTFMFLAYRDAIRTKASKGPIASLLNNFKAWKYEDEKGPRGILFRQPIWIKALLAMCLAFSVRLVYDLIWGLERTDDITFDLFTGYTGWLMLSAVIFIAMNLSYLWPNVKNKIVDIKDETLKNSDEEMSTDEKDSEKINEEETASKDILEKVSDDSEVVENTAENAKEKKQPGQKSRPDDIINEYLK